MKDLSKELDRYRYHNRLRGEKVDPKTSEKKALILRLNLHEGDFDKAEDVFEKYARKLGDRGEFATAGFEKELSAAISAGPDELHAVVRAFWRADRFRPVCLFYAEKNPVPEFSDILRGKSPVAVATPTG